MKMGKYFQLKPSPGRTLFFQNHFSFCLFLTFFLKKILCAWIFCLQIFLYIMFVKCSQKPEDIKSGTGATESC